MILPVFRVFPFYLHCMLITYSIQLMIYTVPIYQRVKYRRRYITPALISPLVIDFFSRLTLISRFSFLSPPGLRLCSSPRANRALHLGWAAVCGIAGAVQVFLKNVIFCHIWEVSVFLIVFLVLRWDLLHAEPPHLPAGVQHLDGGLGMMTHLCFPEKRCK